MNIVIAYDGSCHAKASIDDLRRAGLPHRANALVVSVGETVLPARSPSIEVIAEPAVSHRATATLVQAGAETAQAIDEATALAREGTRRVHAHFPRWEVYADPVVGMPAETIVEKARDWRAELVVIGPYGRSALTRLVVGSVSKQVATESRCSVRVARPTVERHGVPLRIIIGVDGSRGADTAVHAVALRVWPDGTEARLIAVDETVRATGPAHLQPTVKPWISESQEEQIANARMMLKEAAERLRASGLHASTAIKEGNPPYVLNAEAEAWQADCVFVGARGVDTCGRFRAGSVSTALVTRAPCSVEIARA